MQIRLLLLCCFIVCGVLVDGCANPKVKRLDNRSSLAEYTPGRIGLTKQAVLVPGDRGLMRMDDQMEAVYFRDMSAALRSRLTRVALRLPGDEGFPEYARAWADKKPANLIAGIADQARNDGLNALLSTSVTDIRVRKKKTGFWFWRNIKYVLTVSVSLDILDTITSARVVSIIKEAETDTDASAFDAAQNGKYYNIIVAQTLLEGLAVDIADQAVEAMDRLPWQTVVTQVDNNRIGLAAGRAHGLSVGNRLAVFEGRPRVVGYKDQTYTAPGFKVAEIRITAVDEHSAKAEVIDGGGIQVGDIAVVATIQ